MNQFEWTWQSRDSLKFYAKGWAPNDLPGAAVILIHGHGEHIGRYDHVGRAFAAAGYALIGSDLRGHGKSEGQRGHTPSNHHINDDISDFLLQVERRYPNVPRFLYGHSLGGNLVMNFAMLTRPNVKGVISTAPALKLAFEPPAVKVALGRFMNTILPTFSQPTGLETAALSRDPQVEKDYINDPLVHDKVTARLYMTMHEAGLRLLDTAADFPLPMLLMHGGADRISSAAASREFAERSSKTKLRIWDHYYHEIHNEPEKAEVIQAMIDWLDAQLQA
jgi:alpha-beta hydrolase superfamily lysophospholipase